MEFDRVKIEVDNDGWDEKRGRRPKPFPEAIVTAVEHALNSENYLKTVLPDDKVKPFCNTLRRYANLHKITIGIQVDEDAPKPDHTVVRFYAKRRAVEPNETVA